MATTKSNRGKRHSLADKDPDWILRQLWRSYWKSADQGPMPVELHGLTCGVLTERGQRCTETDLVESGRCKAHGRIDAGDCRKTQEARSSLIVDPARAKALEAHQALSRLGMVRLMRNGQLVIEVPRCPPRSVTP